MNDQHRRDIDKIFKWNASRRHFDVQWYNRAITSAWLYPFEAANPLVIPAAAANRALTVLWKQPYNSNQGLDEGLGTPIALQYLVFEDSTDTTALANFTIFIAEQGESRRTFMNFPCHIRTVAGTAQLPSKLRESYQMLSTNFLSAQLQKIAGGETTARVYFTGKQFFPWSTELLAWPEARARLMEIVRARATRMRQVIPYYLTTPTPVTLLANGFAEVTVPIGDDSHFEVDAWAAVSTGNFSLTVVEAKTKQTLMGGPITANNGIGNATLPTLLPTSYLLTAGMRLVMRFTDLSGDANTIFMTFQGRRIYAPVANAASLGMESQSIEQDLEDITMPLPEVNHA